MEIVLLIAIPFFLLALLAEYRWARDKPQLFEAADTRTSLLMGTGSLFVEAGIKSLTIYAYIWVAQWKLYDLSSMSPLLLWAVALLCNDFCYYWFHRAGHRVRILWASHVNHHSSEKYHLATALRQTWSSFFGFVFYLPMAWVGFPLQSIFLAMACNLIYQFWVHTQAIDRCPRWIELVFNAPSHHRVHHGSNKQYIDKNYAGILIVWDRLFGTFEEEKEPVIYGLTKNINSYNLITVAFHEWGAMFTDMYRARRWSDKLRIPFYPPGAVELDDR